jgi:hypothetical protein
MAPVLTRRFSISHVVLGYICVIQSLCMLAYVCVVHSIHSYKSVYSVPVNVCICMYVMFGRLNYAASLYVVKRDGRKFNVQYLTLQLVCSIA